MRIYLYLFLGLLLTVCACRPKPLAKPEAKNKTEIVARYENGDPKTVRIFDMKAGQRKWVAEVHYHPNRKKSMEGPVVDDLRDGEWVSWYENGSIWSKGNFRKGIREGYGVVYHLNGKVQIEGDYLNGNPIGIWKSYDASGNLVSEVNKDLE